MTLIEDDTALVSWKLPDEPNAAVSHYTILYASRKAWVAGEWQVLQREGEQRVGSEQGGEKENSSWVERTAWSPYRAMTLGPLSIDWKSISHFILQSISVFVIHLL